MVSTNMAKAINDQINAETYSAYLYFSMSAWASHTGLPGTANWLFIQGQEELTHAQRFFLYLNRVGAAVELKAVKAPPSSFESGQHVFEEVLKHEQLVTSLINKMATLARDENDHATFSMLQWFVNEQIEEEENVNDILARLKLAGSRGSGLFMIDRELGQRTFNPAAVAAADAT